MERFPNLPLISVVFSILLTKRKFSIGFFNPYFLSSHTSKNKIHFQPQIGMNHTLSGSRLLHSKKHFRRIDPGRSESSMAILKQREFDLRKFGR
ncbi:hypothetical protein LEP1GSC043_2937 [Leptospira weilii str. Ecochallenge]|uniref:Uncharacterized protein n=1 Tax=Leptospira weilii str. Ecochallenge TaxID=1049986 RepID=N1UAK2_9LEPT|nr:hypothetical protein LEP1GSC043_2937 [Leptospira weilii str. Ecochallenge]